MCVSATTRSGVSPRFSRARRNSSPRLRGVSSGSTEPPSSGWDASARPTIPGALAGGKAGGRSAPLRRGDLLSDDEVRETESAQRRALGRVEEAPQHPPEQAAALDDVVEARIH